MAGQAPIIGIDLGTTFSAMAFINEEAVPEIIPNREGERITPSVVLFDGDSPIVGTIAKAAATTSPLNVVQFIKRQMGNKGWKFKTDGGTSFTPEEISALILKRLKEDAEAALGERISDAVITVPAYFNDAQRQATKDAGRIAGLNVIRMINEPTAAALAYGLKQDGPVQTVVIYDLGGGTFDVTILRIGGGDISVVATGGDKNLGGFDWDNALMTHLNEQFKAAGGPDLLDDPEQESNLRAKCELAKKTLSGRDKASVLINVQGKSVTAQVTRDQFEEITKPLFKRTISIMQFVLEEAGLSWNEIDKILLVGGSTRMRGVSRWISEST
ncbi:MAG: Hsp70 family protein, partial [Verrucomicrobiota bacterium]